MTTTAEARPAADTFTMTNACLFNVTRQGKEHGAEGQGPWLKPQLHCVTGSASTSEMQHLQQQREAHHFSLFIWIVWDLFVYSVVICGFLKTAHSKVPQKAEVMVQ